MKNAFYILIIILIYSCESSIKNDEKTLEKIFLQTKLNLEIMSQSCFSTDKNTFLLSKQDSTYIVTCNETKNSIEINQSKFDSLKSFMSDRLNKKNIEYCTVEFNIKIISKFSAVDYTDSSCTNDWNILNQIINFNSLLFLNKEMSVTKYSTVYSVNDKQERFDLNIKEEYQLTEYYYQNINNHKKQLTIRFNQKTNTLTWGSENFIQLEKNPFIHPKNNKKFYYYTPSQYADDQTGPLLFNKDFGLLAIHNIYGPELIFRDETI